MGSSQSRFQNEYEEDGFYLGTEIHRKWWKRYTQDNLLEVGSGKYGYDGVIFHFQRYFTKEPIVIPFQKMEQIKIGKWHSGYWCMGFPIVRIVWVKNGIQLSSGFLLPLNSEILLSKKKKEVEVIVGKLKELMPNRTKMK